MLNCNNFHQESPNDMRPPPLEILGVTPGKNIKANFSSTMSRLLFVLFYIFSVLSAPDACGICFYIITAPDVSNTLGGYALYMLIFPQIIECEVLTSSTAGIKFIADTFQCRAPNTKLNPRLTTLLARQRGYTCSAETISLPTGALSPRLTKLLARQ
jgi:hypothetical protein